MGGLMTTRAPQVCAFASLACSLSAAAGSSMASSQAQSRPPDAVCASVMDSRASSALQQLAPTWLALAQLSALLVLALALATEVVIHVILAPAPASSFSSICNARPVSHLWTTCMLSNTTRLTLDSPGVSRRAAQSCTHCWLYAVGAAVCAGASASQGPLPQGRLKAKVVAADSIRASDTLKEVVVYKIRAADARGEWTVSRRYSNFEQLHRQLRDVGASLPCRQFITAQSCIGSMTSQSGGICSTVHVHKYLMHLASDTPLDLCKMPEPALMAGAD